MNKCLVVNIRHRLTVFHLFCVSALPVSSVWQVNYFLLWVSYTLIKYSANYCAPFTINPMFWAIPAILFAKFIKSSVRSPSGENSAAALTQKDYENLPFLDLHHRRCCCLPRHHHLTHFIQQALLVNLVFRFLLLVFKKDLDPISTLPMRPCCDNLVSWVSSSPVKQSQCIYRNLSNA